MGRIRQARRRAGLSQEELAKTSGVSPATVAQAELGHRQPQGRTLRKLATTLGVEVAELIEEEETSPKAEAPKSPGQLDRWIERMQWFDVIMKKSQPLIEQPDEVITLNTEAKERAARGEPGVAAGFLEEEESPKLADLPPEQVEAWRAEQERENEWIRRELESMSKQELIQLVLSTPPRLKRAYRQAEEKRQQRVREASSSGTV